MGLAAQWIALAGPLWDSYYAYQEHEDDNLGWKPIPFDENKANVTKCNNWQSEQMIVHHWQAYPNSQTPSPPDI